MSQLPRKPGGEPAGTPHVKTYHVELKPRSWLGRTVFGAIAGVLVIAGFVFFSAFLAIGFALLVLAVIIGLIRQLAGAKPAPERFQDPNTPRAQQRSQRPQDATIIDVEQSDEDGVFRPRDHSKRD